MVGDQTLIDAVEAADEAERVGGVEQRVGPLDSSQPCIVCKRRRR